MMNPYPVMVDKSLRKQKKIVTNENIDQSINQSRLQTRKIK